jgi:hypothetical protein
MRLVQAAMYRGGEALVIFTLSFWMTNVPRVFLQGSRQRWISPQFVQHAGCGSQNAEDNVEDSRYPTDCVVKASYRCRPTNIEMPGGSLPQRRRVRPRDALAVNEGVPRLRMQYK